MIRAEDLTKRLKKREAEYDKQRKKADLEGRHHQSWLWGTRRDAIREAMHMVVQEDNLNGTNSLPIESPTLFTKGRDEDDQS